MSDPMVMETTSADIDELVDKLRADLIGPLVNLLRAEFESLAHPVDDEPLYSFARAFVDGVPDTQLAEIIEKDSTFKGAKTVPANLFWLDDDEKQDLLVELSIGVPPTGENAGHVCLALAISPVGEIH